MRRYGGRTLDELERLPLTWAYCSESHPVRQLVSRVRELEGLLAQCRSECKLADDSGLHAKIDAALAEEENS